MKYLQHLIAVLVVLTVPIVSLAQRPAAVITGPTGGVPGDLLLLDASESLADHFTWGVTPELPDGRLTILPIEDGRKCIVTSVPGTYAVFLAVSTSEGVQIKRHVVTITGGNDQPDPVKPDPVKPDPITPRPPPDSPLTRLVSGWDAPVATREAMAAAFDSVASLIESGDLTDALAIDEESTRQNRAAAGQDRSLWLPWMGLLQEELKRLEAAGSLATPEAHAKAWRDIAKGLRKAGQ